MRVKPLELKRKRNAIPPLVALDNYTTGGWPLAEKKRDAYGL